MIKLKVAIILPVYNCLEHLPTMIKTLYESTQFPFKLIVVDGFSDDGTYEYCKNLKKDNIELYQIPKKGLVNAINFGIKKAGKLDIYLTQSDVIHYKLYKLDWLKIMYNIAQKENVGIVIGRSGGGQTNNEFISGFAWAGTWATYIPRKTFDKIGLFDEQFYGADDVDFSYRVYKAKLKLAMIDYWVHHHQQTERNDTHKSEHLKKMYKLLRAKWQIKNE